MVSQITDIRQGRILFFHTRTVTGCLSGYIRSDADAEFEIQCDVYFERQNIRSILFLFFLLVGNEKIQEMLKSHKNHLLT